MEEKQRHECWPNKAGSEQMRKEAQPQQHAPAHGQEHVAVVAK